MPRNKKSFDQSGFTLIEITVTVVIVLIASGAIYHVFRERTLQSNEDSKTSQYYLDYGLFAESLNNDLAMTKTIKPLSNGISLLVNPDGSDESIVYSLNENTIERKFRGKRKVFQFTNPNPKASPLIFRIEEINP